MRRLIWLIIGGLLALFYYLPLSWAAPFILPSNFTTDQTQYRGTVWSGALSNLRDVEAVNYSLKPLNLIRRKMPLEVNMKAMGLMASGQLSRHQIKDFDFKIDVSSLPIPDPRLKGLAGEVYAKIAQAKWDKANACTLVSGVARSNILTQNKSLFEWEGPILAGPISCDADGRVIFELKGEDNTQSIFVKVAISPFGEYNSDMRVITRDQEAALVLPLFGFEERGNSKNGVEFRLVERGKWR
jgi:hypothetical protein